MVSSKRLCAYTMAATLTFANVACGSSFRSNQPSGALDLGQQSVNVDDAMAKAQKAGDAARQAFADASGALSSIMDDSGNIHLSLFAASGDNAQAKASGLAGPLIDKLSTVFNALFAKADVAKQQLAAARQLLGDALLKLNAADPTQSAQMLVIRKELAALDLLEQDFSMAMHLLASKLDLATNSLDQLIQQGTSAIPVPGLGLVAGVLIDLLVVNDVKAYIATIKARLLAL